MLISRIALTRLLPDAVAVPPAAAVRELILASRQVSAGLEHVHVRVSVHRIDITLFVLGGTQVEADVTAVLVGARLCTDLPGWMPGG